MKLPNLRLSAKHLKKFHQSLGQAFSKACGFLRQSLKSPSADGEIPKHSSFVQTFSKSLSLSADSETSLKFLNKTNKSTL